ncbi:MAG TPA: phosphoglycerate mutase family protein [Candidatus Gastranaerophilaceae bacterium]|nr:phosphoglycerate mutase family protein [Candidatus Gastranaerophilaceae bacterium]HPT40755.1 phosphoglycerate mutase family protein [Candidatus Gastranaerophilaceae bacterium]
MFNRKCKITFIAHGATIHSEENRVSDKENYPPINEAGEEEMAKICEWLKKRAIKTDKIYTSPALRTIQSAKIISKALKIDFEILETLTSKKNEEISDFTKRISTVIKQIVEENIGKRIIIVTYPEVIQAAISSAIKLGAKNQTNIYIKTGSASQISYFENWSSLVYSGCVPL